MTWGMIGGAAVATVGGSLLSNKGGGGSQQSGTQTQTTQQQLDPRIQSMLFGDGTDANKGLLAQYQGYLTQPQGTGTAAYGQSAQDWLKGQGAGVTQQLQNGASGLLGSALSAPQSSAPTSSAAQVSALPQFAGANMVAAQSQGTQISAPAQNGLNLSGAYDKVINGDAGANPYLTGALQAGVDATNAGYNRNLGTLTDTLQKTVLPGIRSNAVLAGQYGGSRQGIAEGNALSDFTKQATAANLQLGATNSANTTAAQAQAYNAGQDRSLAALQGLSGQQYGAASQNAALTQQNNLSNAQLQNQTGMQVSSNEQQAILAHQQQLAAANQQSAANQQQTNLANQQAQLATNGQNTSSQLATNGQNSSNQLSGIAGLSGLLAGQYGVAQNQDNYGINRAGQVNGLLAPYLSANGSTINSAPLYQNQGANILGGATAGLGLYNGIKNSGLLGNYGSSTSSSFPTAPAGYWGNDIMSPYMG